MFRRKLQDLALCISYNVNFLHDKAHGYKNFRKQYSLSEEIGRGGFGIVYKAERNEDGAPVAVKFIEHRRVREWTTTCKQLVPTEICLLEMCRGTPGVVRLIDWFANSKGFMIVMERPEECMDLFDLISLYGYLDEKIARSIFVQIVNAVCSLYADYGVLHRDIKDENIIVNMRTGEVILVDFGAATIISKNEVHGFEGTRSYCPPEWFKRVVYMPMEATVWSLGIVLYIIVTGTLPFRNEIQICLGRLTIPKKVSEECAHLIRRCLAVTPERRADLIEIREHRWLCKPIAVHAEPFKCILDRRLSKRLSVHRSNMKRTSSSIAASSDNELISDSPTDISIDICERIRRASSADIITDIHNDMKPIGQRESLEGDGAINGEKFRCFSNYDNVSVDTPTEMLQLVGYKRAYEPTTATTTTTTRTNKFPMYYEGGQVSRDTSTSQYFSARDSLEFRTETSNLSALGTCSISEDESRFVDGDSLQDGIIMAEYNSNPSTSLATVNVFSRQSSNSLRTTDDSVTEEVNFRSSLLDSSLRNDVLSNNATTLSNKKNNACNGCYKKVASPSLSHHRPLTIGRLNDDETIKERPKSLGIFRIDSKKYVEYSKEKYA